MISNRDVPAPDRVLEPWGLCQVNPDGTLLSLASPYWHWGNFYVKLIRSIFSGGWDELNLQDDERAVNYWWGMSSRTVDVLLSQKVPAGVTQLVQILPSTQSHSQSMCSTSSGEKYFSPSLRSWPSWERMGRRKGSMEPSTTPRRRICTSWVTP